MSGCRCPACDVPLVVMLASGATRHDGPITRALGLLIEWEQAVAEPSEREDIEYQTRMRTLTYAAVCLRKALEGT